MMNRGVTRGTPAQLQMGQSAMMQGTEAMMPPNQGATSLETGDSFGNVAAEQQSGINSRYQMQTAARNYRDSIPYQQVAQSDAVRNMELQQSNLRNREQTGINHAMSDRIQDSPIQTAVNGVIGDIVAKGGPTGNEIPSKGAYLMQFNEAMQDPRTTQRIANNHKLGLPPGMA